MDEILLLISWPLVAVLGFSYFTWSEKWYLPSAHFFLVYNVSLGVYAYSLSGTLDQVIIDVNALSEIKFHWQVIIVYDILMISCIITSLGKKKRNLHSLDWSSIIRRFQANKTALNRFVRIIAIGVLIIAILIIFFLLYIDIDLLVLNHEYLLLVDSDRMGIDNPVLRVFHLMIPLIGILCSIAFSILLLLRLWSLIVPTFFVLSFLLVFEMSANSRVATIMVLSFIPVFLLLRVPNYRKIVFFTTVIAIIIYNSCIYGRDQPTQGLLEIPRNIYEGNFNGGVPFLFILFNLFSGAINLAVTLDYSPSYPDLYKFLSFSPLTSEFDNFSKLMIFENRISVYIPYGSITEAYHFGLYYLISCIMIVSFASKKANKDYLKHGLVAYLVWIPLYLFVLASQQYPLRHYIRYIYIAILLSYFYNSWIKKIKQ